MAYFIMVQPVELYNFTVLLYSVQLSESLGLLSIKMSSYLAVTQVFHHFFSAASALQRNDLQ